MIIKKTCKIYPETHKKLRALIFKFDLKSIDHAIMFLLKEYGKKPKKEKIQSLRS